MKIENISICVFELINLPGTSVNAVNPKVITPNKVTTAVFFIFVLF